MKKNMRLSACVGACMAMAGAFATNNDFDTQGCTLGRWTTDYAAAQAKAANLYATGHFPIILADETKNDGSCQYCNTADRKIYDTEAFLNWAKEMGYPLILGDYASSTPASNYIMNNWSGGGIKATPTLVIVDGSDGITRLGYMAMHGGTVTSGKGTVTTSGAPKAGYFINADTMGKDTLVEIVEFVLNQQDDEPYAKTPKAAAGGGNQRNPTARAIVPDARTASKLTTVGLWGSVGLNGLDNHNMFYKETRLQSIASDQFDWYCFENKTAGTAYEMKATELTGDYDEAEAKVFLFKSLEAAQSVSQEAKANQYAKAGTVASDPATGYGAYELSSIQNGLRFTIADKGTVYMLIARRNANVLKDKSGKELKSGQQEEFVIRYAFTLQEASACTYHFNQESYTVLETAKKLLVPVTRSSTEGESVVNVTADPASTATSIEANSVAGHPDYELKNGTLVFAPGEATKNLELTIYESVTNTLSGWYPDRSLRLRVDAATEGTGYGETMVTIQDSATKPEGAEGSGDTTRDTAATLALNDGFGADNAYFVYAVATNWIKFAIGAGKGCNITLCPYPLVNVDAVDYAFYRGTSQTPFKKGSIKAGDVETEQFASDTDDTIYMCLSRAPSKENLYGVCYFTVNTFTRPLLGFEGGDEMSAKRGAGTVKQEFVVLRAEEPLATAGVTVGYRAFTAAGQDAVNGRDYTAASGTLWLAMGDNAVTGTVDILALPYFSAYDRTFTLQLQPSDAYMLGDDTNIVVTILADKSGNDDGRSPTYPHHLKLDEKNPEEWKSSGVRNVSGLATDDWVSVESVYAGEAYRIYADNVVLQPDVTDVTVTLVTNGVAMRTWKLADLQTGADDSACITLPEDYAGNRMLFYISRPADDKVKAEYELKACHWIKPAFSFANAEETVDREQLKSWSISVNRAGNTNGLDQITVSGNGIDPRELTFNPGDDNAKEGIILVGLDDGIWFGDHDYTLVITPQKPDVTAVVEPKIESMKLIETIPEWETAGTVKDSADESAENPLVETEVGFEPLSWSRTLHGDDESDWFVFSDVTNGARYAFTLTNVVAGIDGITQEEKDLGQLGLAVVVMAPGSAPVTNDIAKFTTEFPVRPASCGDLTVQVLRKPAGEWPVSLAYDLKLVRYDMAPSRVGFAVDKVSVSELAAAVYVDVACTTDENQALDADVTVDVVPTEDPEGAYPAEPVSDYDPAVRTLTWLAGTTGGVQRVAVPLTNYDSTWEGDETFLLVLGNAQETEIDPARNTVTVTIVEKDPTVIGTVGVTDYGTDAVREGDAFELTFLRRDGKSGSVEATFTWTDGATKTTETRTLFANRESGCKTLAFKVPAKDGFQAERTATLAYALTTKGATVTKGTPTSFAVKIADRNWGGALSTYSADRLDRVAFRAGGTAWFVDADGALRAMPAKGASSAMTATVTGPGTLTFDATVASGCELTVYVGSKRAAIYQGDTKGAKVTVDGKGSQTVRFVFSHPNTVQDLNAAGTVSNVDFLRQVAANRYGTFKGPIVIDGVPGFGTLTVSTAGRFSGRFACADGSWTLVADGDWADDAKTVTAKTAGGERRVFTLVAKLGDGLVTVWDGETLAGELRRDVWKDQPLTAAAARAIGDCAGYYTVALPEYLEPTKAASYGSGYVTLTVAKNGVVTGSGMLADGTPLSVSALLGTADGEQATAYLFVAPAKYATGWFLAPLRFLRQDGVTTVSLDGDNAILAEIDRWVRYDDDRETCLNPLVSGGWYDKTENLFEAYRNGLTAVRGDTAAKADLAFNEFGSRLVVVGYDGYFSTTFRAATGLLTGYVRSDVVLTSERTVRKSYLYRGVMTPNAYADPCMTTPQAGRGFITLSADETADLAIIEGEEDR